MDTSHVRQLIRLRFSKDDICRRAGLSLDELNRFVTDHQILLPRTGNRQHYVDDAFFSTIDTEPKAYWLGFLYADGCLSQRAYEYTVRLSLQGSDAEHVHRLRDALRAEHPVKMQRSTFEYQGKTKPRVAAGLVISSKGLWSDLKKLGCTPAKTFTLRWPTEEQVPSRFLHHFIRGYFDGDGCMWISKHTHERTASFVSSTPFVEELDRVLKWRYGVVKTYTREHHATPGVSYLSIKRYSDILTLRDCLYASATVWLPRKREAFDAVAQRYDARANSTMDRLLITHAGQTIDCNTLWVTHQIPGSRACYMLRKLCQRGAIDKTGYRVHDGCRLTTYAVPALGT